MSVRAVFCSMCVWAALAWVGCAQNAGSSATESGGAATGSESAGGEIVVTGSRISRTGTLQESAAPAGYDSDSASEAGEPEPEPRSATEYAQAELPATAPAAPVPGMPPPPAAPDVAPVRHDGRTGPLLIYEAHLQLAVYKVEAVQQQAIAAVKELGGFVAVHNDRQRLVLRVPAERFEAARERVEALGEVIHRQVTAQDVSDEFRDLQLRLRNAEAMRDRLAQLLEKATNVTQSLEVERELNRVSEQIELLKGKLAVLSDRIAFSTITLDFIPKREETIDPEFQLPFAWLRGLGLQPLLSMP